MAASSTKKVRPTPYERDFAKLVALCMEHGRGPMIASLEAYHRTMEEMEAYLWGDPATYRQARRLATTLLHQDWTLIRLKRMSDEEWVRWGFPHLWVMAQD